MARYLVAGGTGNWNSITNWSATSGGAPGASFPVSTDDVIIDANSANANLTVNVSSACLSISFINGHTGTFTITSGLNCAGSVTLGSGMTITGSSVLTVSATASLTSNGKTWPASLTFTGTTAVFTLVDNWTVTGAVTTQGSSTTTVNGNTINCGGNLNSNSPTTLGTTLFVLNGSGTLTSAFSSRTFTNNLTINTAGTITIGTAISFLYGGGTFTYTAGTVVTTSSTLNIQSTCTLDTNGITWNNVTFNGTQTVTNNSVLTVSGTCTWLGTSATITVNGSAITLTGTLSSGGSSCILQGTSDINYTGTGSFSTPATASVKNNITINTAGTLTISSFNYNGGVFTYTAGTVNTSGTFSMSGSTTLNTAGIIWTNVTVAANATITLSSLLTVNGTLAANAFNANFAGGFGFTANTFSITTGDIILKFGNTYTVNNFTVTGTAANNGSVSSDTGSSKVVFTLLAGGLQDVGFCSATDVDSSAGIAIYTRKGTISNSTNWRQLSAPTTITTGS